MYVWFASFRVIRAGVSPAGVGIAWWSLGLVLLQLIVGAVNVALLAPVWLQIVHLLIADVLWIALVLLAVEGPRLAS
jgi:cytochrome c oxidase assembly protein subunit 15